MNPDMKLSFNNMLEHVWDRKDKDMLSQKAMQHISMVGFHKNLTKVDPTETPFQKQIRELIFEELNEYTADDVISKVAKLKIKTDSDKQDLSDAFFKFAQTGTYQDLDNMGYVLSKLIKTSLSPTVNSLISQLCKNVKTENISVSYQNRIQQINFIGTLHFYNLIKRDEILSILYSFIDEKYIDSNNSESSFRIRMT